MKSIFISGIHHWGFSVRKPKTSAGGDSYIVPPVTTLLGALSRGYCEEKGYASIHRKSCTEEFIEDFIKKKCDCKFFWIAYGVEEPKLIPYSDLFREERAPYRREDHRKRGDVRELFGVSAFGKVYGLNAKFSISIILDSDKEEILNKLARWSWQITHLGSKESLVSVLNVKITKVLESQEDEFYTEYYLPVECLKARPAELKVVDLQLKNNYDLISRPHDLGSDQFREFLVPRKPFAIGGKIKLKRVNINTELCSVLKFEAEKEYKYIVALNEGMLKYIGPLG